MQVKQHKKSSNKWVCVICNEKQSVQRTYAQSYRAKDVREFVQGFNSGRMMSDRSDGSNWIATRGDYGSDGGGAGSKRMDWSEYLDVEGKDGGALVTTDMPAEKFGSPTSAVSKNLKPKLSKKRANESRQGNSGSLKCGRTDIQKPTSKWSKYLEKEEDEEIGLKFDGDENGFFLGVKDSLVDALIVEEEVHPDFI